MRMADLPSTRAYIDGIFPINSTSALMLAWLLSGVKTLVVCEAFVCLIQSPTVQHSLANLCQPKHKRGPSYSNAASTCKELSPIHALQKLGNNPVRNGFWSEFFSFTNTSFSADSYLQLDAGHGRLARMGLQTSNPPRRPAPSLSLLEHPIGVHGLAPNVANHDTMSASSPNIK